MRTYSLWLTPSAATAPSYAAEVSRLASLHGAPTFTPHVTLLVPDPGTTEAACREACAALAAAPAIPAVFTGVEAGADANHWRFRCVFLRVRDDAAVHELHAAARARLPSAYAAGGYMPHLSLLYSDVDAAGRAAAAADAARALPAAAAAGAALDAIELWDTTEPAPESWTRVARFELARA